MGDADRLECEVARLHELVGELRGAAAALKAENARLTEEVAVPDVSASCLLYTSSAGSVRRRGRRSRAATRVRSISTRRQRHDATLRDVYKRQRVLRDDRPRDPHRATA